MKKKASILFLTVLFAFSGCKSNENKSDEKNTDIVTTIDGNYYGKAFCQSVTISSYRVDTYFTIKDNILSVLGNNYDIEEKYFDSQLFDNNTFPTDYQTYFNDLFDYTKSGWLAKTPLQNGGYRGYSILVGKDNKIYAFETNYDVTLDKNHIFSAYELTKVENLVSSMPQEKPEDFSFKIKCGFDLMYDSKINYLENGYNYDLHEKCSTEYTMSDENIKDIYNSLYNMKFDTIPNHVVVSNQMWQPIMTPYLEIRYGNYVHEVILNNVDYLSLDKWVCCVELGQLINKIKDIIITSDEYKSLPENQNVYE